MFIVFTFAQDLYVIFLYSDYVHVIMFSYLYYICYSNNQNYNHKKYNYRNTNINNVQLGKLVVIEFVIFTTIAILLFRNIITTTIIIISISGSNRKRSTCNRKSKN